MLQKILGISRYMLVIPVFGSLLMAAAVVIMGFGIVIDTAMGLVAAGKFTLKAGKEMSVAVIETIDLFLVGAVAYITAVGIFKLFLTDKEVTIMRRIKIENLNDLESKIVGVVIAALGIAFIGEVAAKENVEDLLYFGAGNALVIGALVLFLKMNASKSKNSN